MVCFKNKVLFKECNLVDIKKLRKTVEEIRKEWGIELINIR